MLFSHVSRPASLADTTLLCKVCALEDVLITHGKQEYMSFCYDLCPKYQGYSTLVRMPVPPFTHPFLRARLV